MSRYIYLYRDKTTGQALYVGSAANVQQRDHTHCHKHNSPIDREIGRRGRDAFTIETLEEAQDTHFAERENYWIDKLETFVPKGFNFYRAQQRPFSKGGKDILIRFSDEEAAALQQRKDETLVPMSQFIRHAVRKQLAVKIVDADSEQQCVPETISIAAQIHEPKAAVQSAPNHVLIVAANPSRLSVEKDSE